MDIDECFSTDQKCGANATCENFPGTYGCECKTGYQQISNDPFQCQDKGKFEIPHKINTGHCWLGVVTKSDPL